MITSLGSRGYFNFMPQASIATIETINNHSEFVLNKNQVIARMSERAINLSLGINDPLTHLDQFIKRGEKAVIVIQKDIETDIAERLTETPFVNYVGFEFTGDDFVSVEDRVSMKSMTETNLHILEAESARNLDLAEEFERAEIEVQEVAKLAAWFKDAPIGANLIFESLPVSENQTFAISRIYQKISNERLEGCFVSLHNSSVRQFNKFRETLCADVPACLNEKAMLQNNYEFYEPALTTPDKFIDFYVGVYDHLLQEQTGKQYSFGLETDETKEVQNGLLRVREQPQQTAIYLGTIKALASSNGKITPEIMQINNSLNLGHQFKINQDITIDMARNFISDVRFNIVSVIDKAPKELLNGLADSKTGQDANFAAASYFGEQARAAGETYVSNGCPEYGRSNTTESESANDAGFEYNAMYRAFNIIDKLDNFGKPKIGVCRIPNCPSHGKLSWMPDKTLVGGCDVCVGCHKLFGEGKSPDKIYDDKKQKEEKKKREEQKAAAEKLKTQSDQSRKVA
jgi:hypothetical protein